VGSLRELFQEVAMRHVVSALVLLSLVAACADQDDEAASSEAGAPAVSTEADIQAISAVRDLEVAAFTSGGEFSYLADDAVLMPPNAPRVVGIEAIGAWAAEFANQVTFNNLDYTESDIVIAGNWAIERYAASVTMTPAGDGDPVSGTNKGIHIYKRQADGSWKMVQDVWNSDQAH
jgi:ketosteroid isomerase-like protein